MVLTKDCAALSKVRPGGLEDFAAVLDFLGWITFIQSNDISQAYSLSARQDKERIPLRVAPKPSAWFQLAVLH